MASGWTITQLSASVSKLVENDTYGQYPFVYVIQGIDKVVVIDCGTGQHNLKLVLDTNLNPKKLPYLLLLTHCHFDHIGGAKDFLNAGAIVDVCLAGSAKVFSNNFETNSLAMAHHGASVKGFRVTRWLEENDVLYLDDGDKADPNKQIHVVFTPGHTPDSAAYWFPGEKRFFIGDTLYPFTAVHVDCLGSNPADFFNTVNKLKEFVLKKEKELSGIVSAALPPDDVPAPSALPASVSPASRYKAEIETFLSVLGLNRKDVENQFSLESLLTISDGSAENAVDFYLQNMDSIGALCPPDPNQDNSVSSAVGLNAPSSMPSDGLIRLSCGHVEENLSITALDDMLQMLSLIKAGVLPPQHVDGEYGEYSLNSLTVMLPLRPKW